MGRMQGDWFGVKFIQRPLDSLGNHYQGLIMSTLVLLARSLSSVVRKIGAERDNQSQCQNGQTQGDVSIQPSNHRQCSRQVYLVCGEQGKEDIAQDANNSTNDEDAPHPSNETPEQSQEDDEASTHTHP